MSGIIRMRARLLGAALVASATLGAVSAGAAEATTPPPPPAPITSEAVRAAKVGWARFVADNFATPDAVPDACPLLTQEAALAHVQALGVVTSVLPYGVSLYRDGTGAGIVGIICGVDLAEGADPPDSTGYAVEVTVLDGQAAFPQFVPRVSGSNETPVTPSAELGGDTIGRCRNEPTVCLASWHRSGLVVTVRLDGPLTEQSEAQARQLLVAVVPEVLVNLALVAPVP